MVSVEFAAKKLNITPQQVRNLCRSGKINGQKVGNVWIIDTDELENIIDKTNLGVAEDQTRYETRHNTAKPIVLSFFSGAMGLDIGIEKAGFETIFACEMDKACRKTILKNKPNIGLIGNLLDYSPAEIRNIAGLDINSEIDLVVGGPPCQAFSTAGKRLGFEDSRGNVFLTFIDTIIQLNPKYAVIENVRGLLSAPLKHRPHSERNSDFSLSHDELRGGALNHIIERLEKHGYGVSFNLYNTANFGTPQKRERVVIICSRNGQKAPYLQPTHSENGEFGLPKWRTFRDAVKHLATAHHEYVKFPDKRIKYYEKLGPGENWRNLSLELQMEALGKSFYSGGGKTGFLRRLSWDKPSPTLLTHPAMPATDLCHPVENRPLSVQEYKAIQEFPDNWVIEGTVVEKYKQIGNAVPVGLGYAIGKLIWKLIENEKVDQIENFNYSRYQGTDESNWKRAFQKNKEAISN